MPLNWSNRMLGETGALDLVKKIVSHQPTPPEWLVVDYGWAATVRDRAGYRGCRTCSSLGSAQSRTSSALSRR
jgi:hypothetical protein